jgi:hypothetical protein
MNNQEAKLILGACRPDGQDAEDATFREALALSEKDSELRAWYDRQRKFDAALSARLKEIAPPAGLRDAIMAGARVNVEATRPRRNGWMPTAWLAAAAAVALVATVALKTRGTAALPTGAQLASFALDDLANHHDQHDGHPHGLDGVQAQLANVQVPLSKGAGLNLDELRKAHCRSVQVGVHEVFEICFNRDGAWYHVYIGSRRDFAPGAIDPRALMKVQGQFAATAWADAEHVYALATRGGSDALQRVI